MRSSPSSIFTTMVSVAMMAPSTKSPSEMMSAPNVIRSKTRSVIIMITNTAAQGQRDRRHHDNSDSPPQTQQADQHHHTDRHRELDHKFVYRRADIDGLIGDFFQAGSQWQAGGDFVAFGPQGIA